MVRPWENPAVSVRSPQDCEQKPTRIAGVRADRASIVLIKDT